MAKQPLKKKTTDFSSIRKKFSSSDKYKEQKYFDLGEAFQKGDWYTRSCYGTNQYVFRTF